MFFFYKKLTLFMLKNLTLLWEENVTCFVPVELVIPTTTVTWPVSFAFDVQNVMFKMCMCLFSRC